MWKSSMRGLRLLNTSSSTLPTSALFFSLFVVLLLEWLILLMLVLFMRMGWLVGWWSVQHSVAAPSAAVFQGQGAESVGFRRHHTRVSGPRCVCDAFSI